MTEKKKDKNKERLDVKTFSIPYDLRQIKENISININTSTKPSKEEIINQASKFHSQGNLSEAAKYYQQFINEGFIDHRVFSNYAIILKDLGKLKEAEIYTRKAIELKADLPEAHYNLGNILRALGNLQEAELS